MTGIQKIICGLPKCTLNIITQLPHDLFGLVAFSLKNAYLRCIVNNLEMHLMTPANLTQFTNDSYNIFCQNMEEQKTYIESNTMTIQDHLHHDNYFL